MKVAILVCLVIAAQLVSAVNLRSRRAALVPAAIGELKDRVTEDGNEMVMAEVKSEADSITEDGSNDESASLENERTESESESAEEEPIHIHFRRFTKPMDLLPNDPTTLIEVAEDPEDSGADKGSNPTYILPVDPFNYFPFFNGFSNVNPFSQFYPPPPYLYPQYTNYMHHYANHGVGHPPAYPYAGQYGGGMHGGHGAYNFGGVLGGPHGGFPYNYGHPHPHMHYPFGAYKMDVSGPDVRTGTNNPPPFPQFTELSSTLIKPELIPVNKDVTEDEYIAAMEVAARASGEAEDSDEDSTEVEFEDSDESESGEATDVEIVDSDSEEGSEMTSNVEFMDEEADHAMSSEVEYV